MTDDNTSPQFDKAPMSMTAKIIIGIILAVLLFGTIATIVNGSGI
jgi:hypothetical protein